ncbi:MAG: response regulator transcription factor [Ignavibacteriaceae bacterium]|jgi:two-component system alkaline phosphatase synthesis response regulator PhoP|nr:response regulator transcription factor [Ignavibacteriaceae bacterium]
MTKILLVDDEPDIVEFLRYNLERENYIVIESFTGEEALQMLKEKPDLILLDIMMPGMNGYEVCRRIKEIPQFKEIPVVFLSALSQENDEIRGLEAGGSDFIKKPISPPKLIARVKANLRNLRTLKLTHDGSKKLVFDNLIIDPETYKILINGKEKFFPKKEFILFHLLASQPGKVFTREEILIKVWGDDVMVIDRTIDVHIRKIREKLSDYAKYIVTIKGVGYKFQNAGERKDS